LVGGRATIPDVVGKVGQRSRYRYGTVEVNVPLAKKYGWKAITFGLGALTGFVTQRVLEVIWKTLRGSTPPKVAADRRSSWPNSVSWAVATGSASVWRAS
jgi:hypothetical protein